MKSSALNFRMRRMAITVFDSFQSIIGHKDDCSLGLKSLVLMLTFMLVSYSDVFAQGNLTVGNNENRTIDRNTSYNNVTITGGDRKSSITISSGKTLTVNNLTIEAPTSNNNDADRRKKYVDVYGTLIVNGNVIMNASNANNKDSYINIQNNSTVTINGDITMNGSNSRNYIRFVGNGTLNIGGTISGGGITSSNGGGNTTITNGTVNYTNSSTTNSQPIAAYTYNNLTLSTGNFSITGNTTVNGNFTSNANAISINDNRTLTLSNGFTYRGETITIGDNGKFKVNGAFTASEDLTVTSKYDFSGTTSYTVANGKTLTFNDGFTYSGQTITINGNGKIKIKGALTVNNDFDLNVNKYDISEVTSITVSNNKTLTLNNCTELEFNSNLTISGNVSIPGDVTIKNLKSCTGGSFSFGNQSKITYNSQCTNILPGTYYDIEINSKVTLCGDVTVNRKLIWNEDRILLGGYSFIFNKDAEIESEGGFDDSHYFVFPYQAESGFLIIKGDVSRVNGGTIPVGNVNVNAYTTRFVTISATTTDESSFSVRSTSGSSAFGSPYDLQCYWTTESENISNATLVFKFTNTDKSGIPANASIYPFYNDGNAWLKYSDTGFDKAENEVTFADCTPTGQWSACEDIKTYYSFTNGNWSDATSWTLDPAGIDRTGDNIPLSGPTNGSRVVIKNPDNITVTGNGVVLSSLTINDGGVLILGETTGHNLGAVKGKGTLKLASAEFPGGTFNTFVSKGGGTVEYYNTGNFTMPDRYTYNNLVMNIASNALAILSNESGKNNITINGNFTIKRGTFQIGGSNLKQTITVNGDMMVEAAGKVRTCTTEVNTGGTKYTNGDGATNANTAYGHALILNGNFTNNGDVSFTNQQNEAYGTAYKNVTNVVFTKETGDQNVVINGPTKFYTIRVQKGIDKTHVLNIDATAAGQFSLLGPRTHWDYSNKQSTSNFFLALAIEAGTVRLGQNITIGALMSGGSYGFKIDETACLWVDGADVAVGSCFALYIHGDLKVSNGTFDATGPGQGIVYRTEANITLDGGEIVSTMLRTSQAQGTHVGSLTINDGILRLTGNRSDKDKHPTFGLTYPSGGFNMRGGELIIERGTYTDNNGRSRYSALAIGIAPDNCNITGGTLKLLCKDWIVNNNRHHYDFYINSTVPFWNVEVEAESTSNVISIEAFDNHDDDGCVDVSIQPFTVLNNLTISNNGTLNTNGQDLYVGGNFTINNTATYTTGDNTTTFNGSGEQNFVINGTLTNGLNNLTLAENSHLNLQNDATVNGTLTLEQGSVFSDLQHTLTVTGDIVNNSGTHYNSASSAGCILLSGGGDQTIGGDGHGSFNNLHINKSLGSVTMTANTTITGNLRLLGDMVLNIGTHNLNLDDADAAIYSNASNGTDFSASKMIQTSGHNSDGGITRRYSSTDVCLFPFGFGNYYLPAEISIPVEPTTYGTITSRPVSGHHYVTSAGADVLQCYWHNTSSGFDGVTSVNHRYYYQQELVGTAEDLYVPAYYRGGVWYPNNNTSLVDQSYNNFRWESCTTINGDFTCGTASVFSQAPERLFSAQSGPWNLASTWSDTEVGGAGGAGVPGANTIVVIGDADNQHNIESLGEAYSGSLSVAEGSSLDLKTDDVRNFGLLAEDGDVDGKGTIIIRKNNYFPDGDFGEFLSTGGGTIEYNASDNDITPKADVVLYNNLTLTASGSNKVTLPNVSLEVFGNLTSAGTNGGASNLFNTGSNSRTVTVDGDLNIESGALAFNSSAVQNIVVKGNINVESDATFNIEGTANVTNQLTIYGNLNVDGALDFVNGAQEVATTFTGTANDTIMGAGTIDFYTLTCDKGTNTTPVLSVKNNVAVHNTNSAFLDLRNGTFRADSSVVDIVISNNSSFEIRSSACLSTKAGTFTLCHEATQEKNVILHGKIEVLGGHMNIGDGSVGNDIEYSSTEDAKIDVQDGTLTVSGQIRRPYTMTPVNLHYSQSGGRVIILGKDRDQHDPNSTLMHRPLFDVCNDGSFTMSGGEIVIAGGALNDASQADILLAPATSSATGGVLVIGNNDTPTGTYYMNASAQLDSVMIGTSTRAQTLKLVTSHVDINGALIINGNSIFNANGFNVNIAGDIRCPKSSAFVTGTNDQLTTLDGTALQTIRGGGNTAINFARLTINNPTTVKLYGLNVNCNGLLTISRGAFDDAGKNINVKASVVNDSRHISSVAGGGLVIKDDVTHEMQSSSGKSGTYGNLIIENRVDMKNSIAITGLITLNDDIYANDYLVKLMPGATFADASTGMIMLNGAIGDAGVRKYFANGFSGEFLFRIGISEQYTPATYNFTSAVTSSDGYINVRLMNSLHANRTEMPTSYLSYYWVASSEGLSGYTITHEYGYTDDLLTIGDGDSEENLVPQRYFEGHWEQFGNSGSTIADDNKFVISGISVIDGEYTAGFPVYSELPPYFSAGSGNWSDLTSWKKADGSSVSVPPSGNPLTIYSGHTITITGTAPQSAYSIDIEEGGILDAGSTVGHNFGIVRGGGTIKLGEINGGGVYSFMVPAGKYDEFFSTATSTIEFDGAHTAVLPAKPGNYDNPLPNIVLSGGGTKNITADVFYVRGSVTIKDGSHLNNSTYNRDFYLGGDFKDENTTTCGYTCGTSKVIFVGTGTQKIEIATDANFYNVQINNAQGVDVTNNGSGNRNMVVSNILTLTSGNFTTSESALIYLTSTSQNAVSGGSANSFVDGPLRKRISASGSFEFPVGDGDRYGRVKLTNVNNNGAATADWTAEYFNVDPADDYPSATYDELTLGGISDNEYWKITRPNSNCSAKVGLGWDAQSCSIFNTYSLIQQRLKLVEYDGSSEWKLREATASGNVSSGLLTSNSAITQESYIFTFGYAGVIAAITTTTAQQICNDGEQTASINVSLSGTAPFVLTYAIDGHEYTQSVPSSTYTISRNSSQLTGGVGTHTVTLVSVSDLTTVGSVSLVPGTIEVLTAYNPTFTDGGGVTVAGTGENRTYTVVTHGSNTYHWEWSGGGPALSGANTNSVSTTYSSSGTYNLVVTETTAETNCQISNTLTISVSTTPQPTFTAELNICEGDEITYTTASVGTHQYKWYVDGTLKSTEHLLNMDWSGYDAGTHEIKVDEKNGSATGTHTETVTVYAKPSSSTISDITPICSGNTAAVQLSTTEQNVTYTLHKADGSNAGNTLSGVGTSMNFTTIVMPTAGTVQLYAEASNLGCTVRIPSSGYKTLTVNESPSVSLNWPTIYQGVPTAIGLTNNSSTALTTYSIDYSAGGTDVAATTLGGITVIATADIAGTITISNTNNCSATIPFNRTIDESYVWSGASSEEWGDSDNWYSGAVPTSERNAIIRTATNLPQISTDAEAKSITIESGVLTVSGNKKLEVHGDWTNAVGNDGFAAGQSTVAFKNDDAEVSGNTTFNSISVEAGKLLTINGQITVNANVANAGTLAGNIGSTLVLASAADAALSAGTYNLVNLTINKPNGVSSAADLNVSGNFVISDGVLSMGTHTLALGIAATATSGGTGAFVDGTMTKTGSTAVVFPIGNSGRRAMVGIEPVGATDASVYTVGYTLKDAANADHYDESERVTGLKRVGGMEKWNIQGTAPSRIKLYWEDSEASGITDLNELVVVHYNSQIGKWEMMETNASGTDGNGGWIQTKPVSNYSPFGFGSTETTENPLPVTFVGFAARQVGNAIELEWATMSEKNNDYFEIERSVDGINFVTIGSVRGAGDSAEKLTYGFADNEPVSGIVYYRLSQVDFDGTRSFADKVVSLAYTVSGNISLSVSPNPTSGQFKVKITGADGGRVEVMSQSGMLLRVVDIHGFMQTIDISDLPNGVYILKYQTDDKSRHERVVKL